MKFNQPKCCAQCFYINPYNNFMICTNPSFPKEMEVLDVSSFRVNPDTIPDWCPYTLTNKAIALMPKEKQLALEKIIDGLSSLLGIDVMQLPEPPQEVSGGNERKEQQLMNRSDACPVCGKQLRWSPPDKIGCIAGYYYCARCKYTRREGDARNVWNHRVRKGKRG